MINDSQNFDKVNLAFSKQSNIYDEYEKSNPILSWMRQQVYDVVLSHLKKGDKILELNSGTGTDAIFFAKQGYDVTCTDLSDGMIEKISIKVKKENLAEQVKIFKCSFTELDKLIPNKFDLIFSNFGGLNCINDLRLVTRFFPTLLNDGGKVILVIMPPVCLWEIATAFKGKLKFAFRRFGNNGVSANVEGVEIRTFYFSAKKIKEALGKQFRVIQLKGLGVFTPIPQMENFIIKHPRLMKILKKSDQMLSKHFPFNLIGDHLILVAQFNPKTK